ncbi:MAG: hypothetical protein HYW02_01415, partial [Deltaproteobacteria bacterium]|nr:hypothetical protein [Deltaproteobacteria bacterium]
PFFIKRIPGNPASTVDLLGEADIEIRDFMVVQGIVYFHGQHAADGSQILGQIDEESGEVTEIDESRNSVIGLEPLY